MHWFLADVTMYDVDSVDYFQRIIANSGTIDSTTKKAVDTFVRALKTNSLWTKISRINLFLGDQLAAAMVPLKVGGGNTVESNQNFLSGDYTLAGGLVGNTTTKYLKTGWIPSSQLTHSTDAHLGSIILAAGSNAATRSYLGVSTSSFAQRFYEQWTLGGTVQQAYLGSNTNGGAGYIVASPDTGHLCRYNTSSTVGGHARNGVQEVGVSTMSDVLPTEEAYVGATNQGSGTPGSWGGHTWGGYHFGTGLTITQVQTLYPLINTLCTAVGRTLPA